MIRINAFAVLLALLIMAACGGSDAPDATRPDNKPEAGQTKAELPGGEVRALAAKSVSTVGPADFLRLSAVRFSPADINAAVDIKAEAVVIPPVPEVIEFEYRWFVNNQEVADVTGSTLPSGSFHKHQWIICEVRAKAGEKVSNWLKSSWLRIANSPPHIEPVAASNFTVPGKFSCQFMASDIDNDDLTYELLAPLDAGIELDKKSGLLTWNLDDKIVEKMGETTDISISVSDNDGKPTTASLTLHFQKKKQ